MKLLAIAASAIAASVPVSAALASQGPCAETLEVHVIDGLLHEPVPDAVIQIEGGAFGVTDARGRYTFEGMCGGRADLGVAHPAYVTAKAHAIVARKSSVEVELAPLVDSITVEAKSPVDMRSTTEVSGEALERKRGRSLSEVVADVPGVTELRSGTGLGKPIVRGHFGRRLPILVDGVRHRAQDWGLDHAPEIDPSFAERVTLIRGASGVRYGSDAIGGVLLVEPPELPRTRGYSAEGHMVGFSNGLGSSTWGRVQAAPESLPRFALQLDAGTKHRRAPSTPDYVLDNTGEAEWSAGGRATYRSDHGEYTLSLRRFDSDVGICSCYRIESADDFAAQLARARPLGADLYRSQFAIARPYQSVTHDTALARANWTLGSVGLLTATYALQHDRRREFDVVRQSTTGPQFSFRLLTHDVDVALQHQPIHVDPHHHLVGGAGLVGMLQNHTYSGLPLVPDHHAASGGAYLYERLVGDEFEIEAGVRYEHLARTASIGQRDFLRLVRDGQLAQDACDSSGASVDSVACASRFQTVAGSLGALIRPSSRWSLKLDLSTASRPPNPDEQYLNGTAPSLPVFGLGQPNLRAETTYSASLSASYASERVTAELSAFASYIQDYISFAPAIGPDGRPVFDVLVRGTFPRFVTRGGDAVFHGADGGVSARPARWLELAVQAAVVRARNVRDGTYLVFVPADRARTSITVGRDGVLGLHRVSASVAGSYVARQSRFDPLADLAPPPAAFFTAETSLGLETRAGGHVIKVALVATNVFGTRYREYTSLMRYFADQPGRQIMLRLTFSYPQPT